MSTSSKDLRARFLAFFKQHQHYIEQSAPLIPQDDPTLLFVNAGMVQFKNVFTGMETRPYKRAATSQKCVRAGGKHNDLENVGHTARHHTFFEMLGNFSFGDYFKKEAITMAWQFLTEELKLDKDRLSVSVFKGDDQVPADHEAEQIWRDVIGVPAHKIKHLGRADNFWQMGESGPCGPCSEIHYDRGNIKEGFGAQFEEDKNIEIWNLVFMQYEMLPDQSLKPLPAPSVDTGMGLERLLCVVNGLQSNYDTDLLRPLIKRAEELSGKTYLASDSIDDVAMRVIADHARACAFLIADGLFPSNEGRGYVLRRFMRRAIRHGAHLGLNEIFFYKVCRDVAKLMGEVYPELNESRELMEKVVHKEEETFRQTLDRGLQLFKAQVNKLKANDDLDGEIVFRLYETYGFPTDITEDLAKERGLKIDWPSFEAAKAKHEAKSASSLGLRGVDDIYRQIIERVGKTNFSDELKLSDVKVVAIIKDGQEVSELKTKDTGMVILNDTPFYGESGGQLGDTGLLLGKHCKALVLDTKKILGLHVHMVEVEQGVLHINDSLSAQIDLARREAIKRNHSATHLLHSALRQILGPHVVQKGSLVAPDRLRFDFAHFEALNATELAQIEDLVNSWILANEKAHTDIMSMDEAKNSGALALFGEKYEDKVRVLSMGSHSRELCGGTHCERTGDVGSFRIISEAPLAQGVRRIEAVTGEAAIRHGRHADQILKTLSVALGAKGDDIVARVEQIMNQLKKAQLSQKSESNKNLKEQAEIAVQKAKLVKGIKLVSEIPEFISDNEQLRHYADLVRDRLQSGLVALGLIQPEDRCTILIALTKDLTHLNAGKLVSTLAPLIDGKGGGRPDFAQAGGTKADGLTLALAKVEELI